MALDDITKLIDAGKEKGYLTYNEVNDLIPHDVHSPEDLDDLLATIGTRGIDVLEGQPKLPSSALEKKFEEEVEAGEIDLTPGALEKTNDPVRIYLREMGVVPLLTREGEVDIAKRIERGQLRVLKALSRSPLVIRQILAIGEDLKRGIRSIKEIVVFDEEEITECRTASRTSRAASTSCRSITKEPTSWRDGYQPLCRNRKHANTAAADATWAARSFEFRSSSATSVSPTASANA